MGPEDPRGTLTFFSTLELDSEYFEIFLAAISIVRGTVFFIVSMETTCQKDAGPLGMFLTHI